MKGAGKKKGEGVDMIGQTTRVLAPIENNIQPFDPFLPLVPVIPLCLMMSDQEEVVEDETLQTLLTVSDSAASLDSSSNPSLFTVATSFYSIMCVLISLKSIPILARPYLTCHYVFIDRNHNSHVLIVSY